MFLVARYYFLWVSGNIMLVNLFNDHKKYGAIIQVVKMPLLFGILVYKLAGWYINIITRILNVCLKIARTWYFILSNEGYLNCIRFIHRYLIFNLFLEPF